MKKIVSIIFSSVLLTLIHLNIYAQNGTPVTSLSPASFTAEDQVTLTADLSGTAMAGASDIYLWIWCYHDADGQAADANATTALNDGGTWASLANPDGVKMTKVNGDVWSFTFTGTTLFGLTPGTMFSFNYLARNIDGSKQTDNALTKGSGFKFDALIFTPTMLRVFPAKIDTNDVVSVNFDQSLATAVNDQRMTPASATITAYDDQNNQIGNPITVTARKTGATIWTATFIPSANFATQQNGHNLAGFKYQFNGTVLDISGSPTTVSTGQADLVPFTPMK
ncbi:hypothetical protein [Ferruginibacter albus]|uniref:hypothetical protein n=1 Tax=Ferruginibacter albus TaxID=2875540 RepID=UPI001CC4EEBB|nr:hypothetical protein [Ferruginibacter albus]UAY51606.1 hypothetical protein K9M53_13545 [Ferruginibacter albus]